MNWLRYLFFSFVSLLIHALAFSSDVDETIAYSMEKPQEQTLSIQLVKPVKAVKKATKEPVKEVVDVEKPKVTNKKSQTSERKAVKKEAPKPAPKMKPKKVSTVTKKATKKAQVKKVIPDTPAPPAVVKKEPQSRLDEPLQEPVEQVSEVPTTGEEIPSETEPVVTKEPIEQQTEQQDSPALKPALPKMIEKVTFSARPSPIKYPRSAKRRNLEGLVLVEVWLNKLGQQTQQLIVTSSGHEVLDAAALKAIREWQFSRQQSNGQAIAYRIQVPINFELN